MSSEREQVLGDLHYWDELAEALGWQTMGFTAREHVSYVKNDPAENEVAQMSGWMRDDIMDAIKRGTNNVEAVLREVVEAWAAEVWRQNNGSTQRLNVAINKANKLLYPEQFT